MELGSNHPSLHVFNFNFNFDLLKVKNKQITHYTNPQVVKN